MQKGRGDLLRQREGKTWRIFLKTRGIMRKFGAGPKSAAENRHTLRIPALATTLGFCESTFPVTAEKAHSSPSHGKTSSRSSTTAVWRWSTRKKLRGARRVTSTSW